MSDLTAEKHDTFDEEGGVSGFVILLIIVAVIITFFIIANLAYQQGMANARNELPRIAADPTPVKTQSDQIQTDPSNPEVYDRLEGTLPTRVVISSDTANDPLEGFSKTVSAARQSSQTVQDQTIIPTSPPDKKNTAHTLMSDGDTKLAANRNTSPRTTAGNGAVQSKPATKAPLPKTKPIPSNSEPQTSTTDVTPELSPRGAYLVQLASFRSAAEAKSHFDKLETKLGSIISAKVMDVEQADLRDRGVWYRLRVGPFASKEAATSYCQSLKTRGQDCIVKQR